MGLIDAIRDFCQNDPKIKSAVGGTRDAKTPYTTWCSDAYNFPYTTMTEIPGGKPDYTFGERNSPYLEYQDIQFTFWDDGTRTGEDRIRSNIDYFSQTLNGEVLTISAGSRSVSVTMTSHRATVRYFARGDPNNSLQSNVWMASVVFRFTNQRTIGVTE